MRASAGWAAAGTQWGDSMFERLNRVVAVGGLVLSASAAVAGIAAAAPGPGTFTRITTPGHTFTYHWNGAPGAVNHVTVSGTTSHDVTTVNIDCILLFHDGPSVATFAAAVPVTGGSFSTVATISSIPNTCRLRAVPNGVDAGNDYLGSFSGPIMFAYGFIPTKDGTKTVGYSAFNERGTGLGEVQDAAECGVEVIGTLILPAVELRGPGTQQCAFSLPADNLTTTGTSTATAIRVDGKNAYLPNSVYSFLRNGLALTLTQPAMTTTFSRNNTTGDMSVVETSRLKRCSGDNTYPPTSASCASLVDTGVTFTRAISYILGAHQILMRDSYASNDGHAHTVTAQYQCAVATAPTGAPGYIYPGHGTSFSRAAFDKVVTGFGPKATATMLVRSDIFASSVDEQADTQALTWSRPPSKIQFAHASTSLFAMPYSFSIPAHGVARIGFAESEAPLTADAKKLAAKAEAAL